jgi:hypothetical protein
MQVRPKSQPKVEMAQLSKTQSRLMSPAHKHAQQGRMTILSGKELRHLNSKSCLSVVTEAGLLPDIRAKSDAHRVCLSDLLI